MKKILLFIVSVGLFACQKEYKDSRPADQLKFVNVVKGLRDSVNAFEKNPAVRTQVLEKGVERVKAYIKDSLSLSFNSWEARVLNVSKDPESGRVDLFYGFNIDGGEMSEKTRFQSIVLKSAVDQSDTKSAAAIKALEQGDLVKISGSFSTARNYINIDKFDKKAVSNNVFQNPEFKVDISVVEEE